MPMAAGQETCGMMKRAMMMKGLVLSLALLVSAQASAQTTTVVIGYPPGASYDIYARTFARHLGKHLPGNPTVIPQNMAGAGSLRAANFLYNAAPKDGSTIGMFARGLAMQPLLDDLGVQYDARKFNWIGSLTSEVSIVLSWQSKPFKTLDDAKNSEMIVAASGSGADSVIFPYILNGVLGTKFKVVTGYPGNADMLLAVERGEADGNAGTSWSGLTSFKPEWIRDKKINVMVQLASRKHPDLGNVPLVMDLAKNASDKGVLELIFARQQMAYPVVAPPGVPAERVQALRQAFDAVLKDPEYLADSRRQNLEADPANGAEIAALVDKVYASAPEVVARAKAAMEDGKKITTSK
jgi:tripartite-type tricarboxylate transporter receptor subunit TctC